MSRAFSTSTCCLLDDVRSVFVLEAVEHVYFAHFESLGERAAAAVHEQPQQRRKREIREGNKYPPMLPKPAAADIENRNLVLKPLTQTDWRSTRAKMSEPK